MIDPGHGRLGIARQCALVSISRSSFYYEGTLKAAGVAAVFTPKDYDLTAILADVVEIVDRATREAA